MDNLQSIPAAQPEYFNNIQQPVVIRFFAQLFSFVFHPLFISIYATFYLTFLDPAYFNGVEEREKMWVVLQVAFNITLLPAISVLLLKAVGFIDSIFLKTQKERIIPYIISNIFFFWMYLVFHNHLEIPLILTSFVFGVFLSSSAALLANIYFKISMHAIGVGGLTGMLLVILFLNGSLAISLPLALAILITGIVCTSRMIVSNHSQKDIYAGLLCGVICQVAAAAFILSV